MANFRYTLTADAAEIPLALVKKPRSLTFYEATIYTYGDFDSGTVAYFVSPDNGTTLIPLKDAAGSNYTTATDDSINIELGVANHNGQEAILYASLTGSTAPAIIIDIHDNT